MCGRYSLEISPQQMMEMFGLHRLPEITARYNIAPSQNVPAIVLAPDSTGRIFKMLKWGLIPSWSKSEEFGHKLINARAETINEKPSFREAFQKRRCLIPTSGFYEWKKKGKEKQPYFIGLNDQEPFAFAGLWESWQQPDGPIIESTSIITTTPNPVVKEIHPRMPVILPPEAYALWLDRTVTRPEKLLPLLSAYPGEKMMTYPVSNYVNNPRNEDVKCLEPIQ
jgi:putative SOS response-associated peptidase YedK